jgi:cytochrome c oxidase subunit 2
VSLFRSHPRHGVRARQLRRWLPRTALVIGLVTMTAGCQSTTFTRLGLVPPATSQGQTVINLWQGSWIAALCVGVIVWGLILWAVAFHRKRKNDDRPPRQVRYNLPIEVLYTVVPFVMVGVLFFFTARDENQIDSLSAKPNVVVNVTGFRWSWSFQYPQYQVAGGKALCGSADVCELGAQWNGQIPGNESQMPLLEIPVHERIRFNLVSTDVIHSFWVIPFEFKRDVVPGHPNHFEVTTTSTGSSIGRCSELCGLYHSRMLFRVKIVSQAQFNAWISQQQAQQNAAATTTSQITSGSTK